MKDRAIVTIQSHPKYLSVIRAVTVRMGELCGMSDSVIEDVKLAVDEACSNVIKHAYKGDTGKRIVVKYRINKKFFEVTIEDEGVKSRPESMKGRSLDELKPGGLGIHFIKRTFDVFALDEKKKKGNRLRLVRYFDKLNMERQG